MHIFDFDKTITHKDSTYFIFKSALEQRQISTLKFLKYLLFTVFTKAGFIKIETYKKLIFYILFYKKKQKEVENFFNSLVDDKNHISNLNACGLFMLNHNFGDVVLVSATPYLYLKAFFPSLICIGTEFKYSKDGYFDGLQFHCYGKNKLIALKKNNISSYDFGYSDSMKDYEILSNSKTKAFLIKKNYSKEII